MKPTDINAKYANILNGEQTEGLIGIGNIFQIMDLVAEKQNCLEMLQNNGVKAIKGKRGIGDESFTY
jgi:hypothetical protein